MTISPTKTCTKQNMVPNSEDGSNRLIVDGNYGWPNDVGFNDDMAFRYENTF
ncbi:MAG: hypothetical protein L0H53_14230 [Candidatus Nitrosocosmicus sp.]|nr:hypothetical protein [Candidatus Nitrosocosmicus sp.]MDN5867506.1 hypothetical protein [Candidatus Nitrosocosmicus sp.]